MKLASCLAALFFLPLAMPQKAELNQAKPGLHDIILKTVHDTASYLGFGVTCRNGGHKTEENTCICSKYYKGNVCETKICINKGKLERVTVPTVHHVCKCPYPNYIAGEHCEKIRCDNNGALKTFPNGTWQCDCTDSRFYGGQFCEKFILSTTWIMALICLGVLIIVGFICSSNWFSRKRDHRRYNTNRCPAQSSSHPRSTSSGRDASGRRAASHHRTARSSSADDLISSERGAHRRTAAYPEGLTQQYVVRLDTIPTFNPSMIGGVDVGEGREQTPVGPPPSYDQAMSSHRVEPPEYTPTDVAKLNA